MIGNGLSYGLEDHICKVPYNLLGVGRNEDKKHINEFKIAGQTDPKDAADYKEKMKTLQQIPKQSSE